MSKKCIGYNDITKKFIYQDEETGLITQDSGVLGVDKIEEIKTTFGINGTGDMFTKSKRCECCKVEFLLRDIKGDLCVNCYDFIEERQNSKIDDLEAKLAQQPKQIVEKIREKIVDYDVKYSSAVDVLNCLDLVLDNLLKEMK